MQKIALIGFGTVGQGLCEILRDKSEELKQKYDYEWNIVAVSDMMKGSVYCSEGLNVNKLLDYAQNGKSLNDYDCKCKADLLHTGWDAIRTIKESNADVICELAFTDLQTGEPAISHCKAAFESGKSVVTSNKGPAALAYQEMKNLASANNVDFLIEGTVASGTPILNLVNGPLAGCEISSVKGILNGTTNYILTQMENGDSYSQALTEAQEKGYAEADPSGDVEGHDAAGKLVILANLLMSLPLTVRDVECQGITQLAPEDIVAALKVNERWKLIGVVEKTKRGFNASVMPTRVAVHHPLSSISGVTNAITYTTDLLGKVTLVGPGAGRIETGYALIQDMLAIHRKGSP